MKFLRLLCVVLILPNFLFSSSIYIKVASTQSKNNLKYAKERLKRLGINMIYKEAFNSYVIFSGPYKNEIAAMRDIQKMKRYFPHAASVMIDKEGRELTQQQQDQMSHPSFLKNGFNVAATLGYNKNTSSYNGTTTVTLPKDSGLSYSVEAGYSLQNALSFFAGYAILGTSDISVSNIYGGVNYRFANSTDYIPYLGLLGGMSTMSWNTSPLTTTTESLTGSTSALYGAQTGVIYDGFENLGLFLGYQLLFVNHSLQIDNSGSSIEHSMIHNVQLGIRYYF